jgi:rare lipoprotein A
VYERNTASSSIASVSSPPSAPSAAPAADRNTLPPHLSTAGFPRKTGNPYVIDGIRYYPLQYVLPGFEEVGIASWYGIEFHGKPTASGEIYNMHDMTAAHRVLPLPIFVRVENLDNGKETIVRLNDRGPFARGRIIDLSYAAAKEIDMVQAGTARVRVTVLSEFTDYNRVFLIQIGSFSDRHNAERQRVMYPNAAIRTTTVNGRNIYRVKLKYTSRSEAQDALTSLKQFYPGAFVMEE